MWVQNSPQRPKSPILGTGASSNFLEYIDAGILKAELPHL